MARNIPRHRRQRQSFTVVAATTTPKDALTLLIDWDLKSENAETHTETEQHAFVVWKKDNNRRTNTDNGGSGGSAFGTIPASLQC